MKLSQTRNHRRKVEINLVPLLDSIFILIFFFMFALTTMVKRNGLSVALPKTVSGKQVNEKTTLTIKSDGRLFWNKNPLSKEQLTTQLQSFKERNLKTNLVIRGDKNTPFQNIVEILDIAEKIQLKKVTIETESK